MNEVVLQVKGISKSLGGKSILDNCSLNMKRGELKVLIGPSGAGKSTLLQCINCLIPPDKGEIILEGEKLDFSNKSKLCAFRAQVGMIFQDFNLFDHLTAEENVAIALRKALLDDVNITQGPQYEAWAAQWLAENPGKTRLDVPPLKISMTGRQLIMPGRRFAEYQVRTKVERVDEVKLEKMDIKVLYVRFPFDQRPDMVLPIYASKMVLRDYDPQEGDEVDAYVWLQGRVIDMDESPAQ